MLRMNHATEMDQARRQLALYQSPTRSRACSTAAPLCGLRALAGADSTRAVHGGLVRFLRISGESCQAAPQRPRIVHMLAAALPAICTLPALTTIKPQNPGMRSYELPKLAVD